jgi:thiamine pyrophosphate-dependent acetolactate synthase large subunit-like protein
MGEESELTPPPTTPPPTTPPPPTAPPATESLDERIKAILKAQEKPTPPAGGGSSGDSLEQQVLAILEKQRSNETSTSKVSELEKKVTEQAEMLSKLGTRRKWWQPWTPLGGD